MDEIETDDTSFNTSQQLFLAVLKGHYHRLQNNNEYDDDENHHEKGAEEAVKEAEAIIVKHPQVLTTSQNITILTRNIPEITDEYMYLQDGSISLDMSYSNLFDTTLFEKTLPIHWTIFLENNNEMIRLFLRHCPESASSKTSGNREWTPLHVAVSHQQISTVQILLQLDPTLSMIKDEHDTLPIAHAAIGHSLEIIKLLSDSYPEGLSIKGYRGKLPLHAAIMSSYKQNIIEILERYPDAAKILCDDNLLPIHQACIFNPSMERLMMILYRSNFYGLFEYVESTRNQSREVWNRLTPWMGMFMMLTSDDPEIRLLNDGPDEVLTDSQAVMHIFEGKPAGAVYPHILHHCIGKIPVWCMKTFLYQSVKFQIDLDLKDEEGRTPLMIAIHKASQPENEQFWNDYYKSIIEELFRTSCRRVILQRLSPPSVAEEMYQSSYYPFAHNPSTLVNTHGRHLLHIVAEEGLPWYSLKDIVQENIDAVRICDYKKKSGLFPFLLASVGTKSDLTSAFELLRLRPDLLDVLERIKDDHTLDSYDEDEDGDTITKIQKTTIACATSRCRKYCGRKRKR